MRLIASIWCVVLAGLASTVAAQQPARAPQEPPIVQPLTAAERLAAVKLTRLHDTRLWWNDGNRVIGASFKGDDANDRTLALAGALPGLRSVVLVALPECQLTDNGLEELARLPRLELLTIVGNRITDSGMVHVARMTALRVLTLNCNVTDSGLELLAYLPNLERLDLTQTKITDAGIGHLQNFARLNTLVLNGTPITDEALPAIAQLKTLQQLYLGNTSVDDAAVATLAHMEQLQLLYLMDTQMTAKGVEELQPFFLESCTIIHQSGTYQGTRKSPVAMATVPARSASSVPPTIWHAAK